jgi:mitotic spindle assembly checkpoint protein MAD2
MTISNVLTREVIECWDFKVESEVSNDQNKDPNNPAEATSNKELKKIQSEIAAVLRQVAATVSYLPLIDCICSFDILIHTYKDCPIPVNWGETENVSIKNGQVVNLKSFSTGLQKVDTVVSYKMTE